MREVARSDSRKPWLGVRAGRGMVRRGASVMMGVPRGRGRRAKTPRPLLGVGLTWYRGGAGES